jgi:20S proteasome alpha/beta subunit
LEELNYSDMPPTIFSPTGRLHPVERVLAASKLDQPRANLVIAVTCNKGVVILSTLTTCAHLNTTTSLFVPSSIAPIFELSPQIVAVAAGNAVDGQVLKLKVQRLAEKIIEAQGDDENLRASELSRRLADMLQVATQTVGGKGGPMLAVRSKRYLSFLFFTKKTIIP